MTQAANLPKRVTKDDGGEQLVQKQTKHGCEYKTTKGGRIYFLDTPGLDNIVRLHWEQGWPESLISKNMGFPRPQVDAICAAATEEYLAKSKPLPKKLGEKGANNTQPSEIG